MAILDVLKGRPAQFPIESIKDDDCVELAIRLMDQEIVDDELIRAITEIEKNPANSGCLRRSVVALLYRVGVIGLKLERFEGVVWSTSGRRSVSISEIASGAKVSIHPCFWRSLGINPESGGRGDSMEGFWPSPAVTIEI
jgi:hypothetical protein